MILHMNVWDIFGIMAEQESVILKRHLNISLAALKDAGIENSDVDIPDIADKIAELETEIKKIKETDPYMYRFLLEDPAAVKEKKEQLKEELNEYNEYSDQLEKILCDLLGNGVRFTWRMN